MTRPFYLLVLALLSLCVTLPSCKQQDDIEETSLTVSTETLTFGQEASEQEVTVQTTAEHWSYLSPQEFSWFTLSQTGNRLKVSVTANTQGVERTGVIAVTSGGQQRRILVKQSAADLTLDLQPARVLFPQTGGERAVSFHSNGQGVKAELADQVDWLTIEQGADRLTLRAQPNPDKHQRQTKVNVLIGTLLREITVEQEGTVSYFLPLLQFPSSAADVIRYEQARGSILVQTPIEVLQMNSYRFLTTNANIPIVDYSYYEEGSRSFYRAVIISKHRELFENNPDFATFLETQGFTKVSEEKSPEETRIGYVKENCPYALNALYGDGGAGIELVYVGQQKEAYATFATLPMREQITRLGSPSMKVMGASREDVRKYEEGQGSTLDANNDNPAYDRYSVAEGKSIEGEYVRGYFFTEVTEETPAGSPYLDHVEGVQAIYGTPSLAFFADDFGEPHLTREVTKLFTDAGYPYLRKINSGREVFYSQRDKLAYLLKSGKIEGKELLEVQVLRVDLGMPSRIARLFDYKGHLLDEQRQVILLERALKRLHQR